MNTVRLTEALLLIVCFSYTTNAIKCWECDNAVDDEDCMERGTLRNCNDNEERCFTETRLIQDGRKLITRRCKQRLACFNNNYQNQKPAWDPTQCNKNGGSVCRCCCSFDECNAFEATQCLKLVKPRDPDIKCKIPQILENGKASCKKFKGGLVCNYKCNKGYQVMGTDRLVCDVSNYNEMFKLPYCEPIAEPQTCKLPESPANGYVFCDEINNIVPIGNSCEYMCEAGYELEGSNITTCLEENQEAYFSSPPPTCIPISCPAQTNLRRVKKQCTFDDKYESKCFFSCQGNNQTPNPGDFMRNECLMNGSWSHPAPCCRLPCPPYTVMDFFIVLDSSSSVGPENFDKMRVFVAKILGEIILDDEHTQAFIMTYNKLPNKEKQVTLNQNEDFDTILSKLRTIPGDGRGTMTGAALEYVHSTFLHQPENREEITDVVLLITDGRSQDEVGEISRRLRKDGVETFAIGVTKNVNEDQLLEITGNSDKMWANIDSFDDFTAETASKIGNYICEKSCA